MKKISYYAVFENDRNEVVVKFPDLPGCFSVGKNNSHAKKMAKEALCLYLDDMELTELPKPTSLEELKISKSQNAVLISADLEIKQGKIHSKNVVYMDNVE